MKAYFLKEFTSETAYKNFISYMLEHSDAFSLVYFRYNESEKMKKTTRKVHEALRPFKIHSHRGTKWASMETRNDNNHIYKIVLYRADPATEEILKAPGKIFAWDYPELPMDLCFFREHYGWLAVSSHENYGILYTNNDDEIAELKELGANLRFWEDADDKYLFFEQY